MKSNINNVEEIIAVADDAKVKKTVKDSVFTEICLEIQSICSGYINRSKERAEREVIEYW